MDALSFAFWVHGFDEISGGKVPDATQWAIIQDHLKLVFNPARQVSGLSPLATSKFLSYC